MKRKEDRGTESIKGDLPPPKIGIDALAMKKNCEKEKVKYAVQPF